MLAACAAALPCLAADDKQVSPWRKRMGVVLYSYSIRSAASKDFNHPLNFLAYCRRLGAGGIQLPLGAHDKDSAGRLRSEAEDADMYVEGSIRLPQDRNDLDRFAAEVRTARDCGATVLR